MIALINFCGFPWLLKWLLPFLLGLLGGWAWWSKKNNYEGSVTTTNTVDNKLQAEYDSCKNKRLAVEKEYEACRKKVNKLEKQLAESKKSNLGTTAATALAGGAVASVAKTEPTSWNVAESRVDDKEQIKTLKASLDSMRSKNNDLTTKYDAVKKENDDLTLRFDDLQKEVAELKGNEEEKPTVNVEDYESKIKDWEDKYTKSQEDISNLKTRYANVDKEIGKAEREATEWKIKYNALKQQTGGLKGDVVGTSAIVSSMAAKTEAPKEEVKEEKPVVEETQNEVKAESTPVVEEVSTPAPVKKSPFSKIAQDNLQIVEGIGPKMEEVLKTNGIVDFTTLAGKSKEDLRAILDKYEGKYKIIDPTTWPQQAKLASDKEWENLIQLQKDLDGGSETAQGETDSKLEKYLVKIGAIKQWKKDDLKAIEGIGPKLEEVFHNAGIKTWKAMSETSLGRLKEILEGAGSRFALAVPDTWAKQAKMADEGKWDELEAYQDYLDGGREPS